MKGELGSDEGAQTYADQLRFFVTDKTNGSARWPRLDLVLLGMGADGHTASLFPYSSLDVASPTMAVEQEYQDRPAQRISLTPVIINDARRVWFIVSGVGKAEMVHKVLRGEQDPFRYPAQRIAPRSGRLTWMLDSGAAAKL